MFQSLLKHHLQNKDEVQRRLDALKLDADVAIKEYTSRLAVDINKDVAQLFLNQQDIEHQVLKHDLLFLSKEHQKQLKEWHQTFFKDFSDVFRELGDVGRLSEVIGNDMQIILKVLERVQEQRAKAKDEAISNLLNKA